MRQGQRQRGQAMAEYAVVGMAIILAVILSATLLRPVLTNSLENTRQGLDTPVQVP